jgi:hypothetical protein
MIPPMGVNDPNLEILEYPRRSIDVVLKQITHDFRNYSDKVLNHYITFLLDKSKLTKIESIVSIETIDFLELSLLKSEILSCKQIIRMIITNTINAKKNIDMYSENYKKLYDENHTRERRDSYKSLYA